MRPAKYKKQKIPSFIAKLYEILNDPNSQSIIEWTPEKNSFIIIDLLSFTQNILPQYFKHSNFSSFIRQLNMYDFTKKRQDGKVGEDEHIYYNENFECDNLSKLKQIKRKQILQHKQMVVYTKPIKRKEAKEEVENQNQEQKTHESTIHRLETQITSMKSKQEQLKQIIYRMVQQNQILISNNKDVATRIKKQTRRKNRIIEQVFRIVGASITQFWTELCDSSDNLDKQTTSLTQLYRLLVQFIDQSDMQFILKALDLFLMKNDEKKVKIFNIMTQNESSLFPSHNEEEINEFISATTLLFQASMK